MLKTLAVDTTSDTILKIMEAYPDNIEGFREASQVYGSQFFAGESLDFRTRVCTALRDKFKGIGSNNYWNSHS